MHRGVRSWEKDQLDALRNYAKYLKSRNSVIVFFFFTFKYTNYIQSLFL